MTLDEACRVLTRHRHCDADWCVAFNGLGPHAWGVTEGRKPNVNLPAEDAIELAARMQGRGCQATANETS